MNPFEKLMNDVFNNDDFLEDCYIGNLHYKCIVSPIVDNVSFSEVGLVDEENFTIDIKLPMKKIPDKNDKIKFRNKWYKVSNVETDSANTSIKIHIISLSKGIGA